MSTHASARRWAAVRDAVEGLAQIEVAALVLLVGITQDLIRLKAVAKLHGCVPKAPRIERLGRLDEDAFGLSLHLVAQLLGRACDQRGVGEAEVAVGKGLHSLWK